MGGGAPGSECRRDPAPPDREEDGPRGDHGPAQDDSALLDWDWLAAQPAAVVEKVRAGKGQFGFDAQKEEYGDLVQAGIIDPVKVVRVALENAASIAGLMLTTQAVVVDKPKPEKPAPGATIE